MRWNPGTRSNVAGSNSHRPSIRSAAGPPHPARARRSSTRIPVGIGYPARIEPRRHHYAFAHIALRDVFHYDPARVLDVLEGPRGREFVEKLWIDVGLQLDEADRLDGSLGCEAVAVDDARAVLVWLPLAKGLAECHAVALLLDDGASPHFLTLEVGESGTMLGGWSAQGEDFAHFNLGDGPAPTREALVGAVTGYLDQR